MNYGNWKAGFLWGGCDRSIPDEGAALDPYDMYNRYLSHVQGQPRPWQMCDV
jgi:hypothetical protein